MPSTIQRALPRFPAAIVGTGNIAVSIAGGVATISSTGDATADPTVSQYLRALVSVIATGRSQLEAGVSASPDDPNRIVLEETRTVQAGGAYETLVASVLNLPATTVAAIRTLALLQPL